MAEYQFVLKKIAEKQINAYIATGKAYMGHFANCMACPKRAKCIRKEPTKAGQVVIPDKGENAPVTNYTARMKEKADNKACSWPTTPV